MVRWKGYARVGQVEKRSTYHVTKDSHLALLKERTKCKKGPIIGSSMEISSYCLV